MSKEGKYSDILNMPRHESKTHPHMSLYDRAAQFAPFAALTGLDDAMDETARKTDGKIEYGEDYSELLNEKFLILKENFAQKPKVSITYFVPDERKEGGSYRTFLGTISKIDEYGKKFVTDDGTVIPFGNVSEINFQE